MQEEQPTADSASKGPTKINNRLVLEPSNTFLQELAQSAQQTTTTGQQPSQPASSQPSVQQTTVVPSASAIYPAAVQSTVAEHKQAPSSESEYASMYPSIDTSKMSQLPKDGYDKYGIPTKVGFFESTPKGIIVIVALTIFGNIATMLTADKANTGVNYNVTIFASIIGILLALGLFFGKSIARLLFIAAMTLVFFSSLINFLGTMDLRKKVDTAINLVSTAKQNLEEKKVLTSKEKADLEKLKQSLVLYDAYSDAFFTKFYITFGLAALWSGFVTVYLLRPSIKDYYSS